jgi:mannitol/fructose-specific phosphotransferase system IIA component (Ntr-type)
MLMNLEKSFSPEMVFALEGKPTRDEVLHFVSHKLVERQIIKREDEAGVLQKLKERENKASTGIGEGIALPHIFINGLLDVLGVVVQIPLGVDWQAIDKEDVKLVIFLFAGEAKRHEYLETMAEVARILTIDAVRRRVMKTLNLQRTYELLTGVRVRKTFFTRYSRYIYFSLGVVAIFTISRIGLSAIRLPPEDFYLSQDLVKFNEPMWIGREILTTTLFFSTVLGTLLFFEY